jgi:hypothetical protein
MLGRLPPVEVYHLVPGPIPSEDTIRRGSSGSTLVSMMESLDLGERDDLSEISVVDRPPFRRVLRER